MKFLLIFLFLTGCAGLPSLNPAQTLGGAGAGVAGTKAVEAVKEAFTPKFLLQFNSIEICSLEKEDVVDCYILPCGDDNVENCKHSFPHSQWIAENPKVITLRTSQLVAVKLFCQKNPEFCEYYASHYVDEGKIKVGVVND